MPKAIDYEGKRFGRLLVNEFAGRIKGKRYYYCTCDCGNETLVSTSNLSSGNSTSCGCLTYENAGAAVFRHGGRSLGTQSVEYTAWIHLKDRHLLPDAWNNFQQFFRDVGWRPEDTYELSRYDLTQPHGPENTYWRNPNEERQQRINADLGDELCIDLTGVREADAFAGATT